MWPIIDFIYTGECLVDASNVELFFQEGNNLGIIPSLNASPSSTPEFFVSFSFSFIFMHIFHVKSRLGRLTPNPLHWSPPPPTRSFFFIARLPMFRMWGREGGHPGITPHPSPPSSEPWPTKMPPPHDGSEEEDEEDQVDGGGGLQ